MIEFDTLGLKAPDGCIIGVIEEGEGSAWPRDDFPAKACNAVLQHPCIRMGAIEKAQTVSRFMGLRRAGATLVLITHDEPLLERCADEIWWLRDGRLAARGDPAEVLLKYRQHVADVVRASGSGENAAMLPAMRSGDGRAALDSIELMGEDGQPSRVWRSGEVVAIRVTVVYAAEVEDPVVGVLIRTRIGLNVYGTNTGLERLHPGPLSAGDMLRVTYRFTCGLCPGEYTISAASHDPDGVWHDWHEDAVAVAVTDSRYTEGVANLRAEVDVQLVRRHRPGQESVAVR